MGVKKVDPAKPRSKAPKPPPKGRKRADPPPPDVQKKLWDYLAAIAGGARHSEASILTGLPFGAVRLEFSRNEEYRAAYKKAEADREDMWMAERYDDAHHRATKGVPRSVTCGSGICGTDMYPSDRMMEVLLKKDHPEWFRQEVKAEHDLAPALVELIMHVEKSIPQGSGSAKTVEG